MGVLLGTIYLFNLWYSRHFYNKKKERNRALMSNVMGSVFLVFGLLKLVNLGGFVTVFSRYDLLSQRFSTYGYAYPFVELALAASLLYKPTAFTYAAVICLMGVSLVSVFVALAKGVELRCGCLGSFLHIPLSFVTITENVLMLGMAVYLLLHSGTETVRGRRRGVWDVSSGKVTLFP